MRAALSRAIPESICGFDTDELFGYNTDKVVWIRDRHLGIPYYALLFVIACYIFGVQMVWNHEHFTLLDVSGLAHVWYSHPTVGHCDPVENGCMADFTDPSKLPYCREYKGDEVLPGRASCSIEDFVELIPSGSSDDKLFVPTSVEVFTEVRSCPEGDEDDHRCSYTRLKGADCLAHGKYMCQTRGGQVDQFFYVADAERYQLRFTSSFERNGIRGTSLEYPGYLGVCERLHVPRGPRTWGQRKADQSAGKDCHGEAKAGFNIEKIGCQEGKECVEMRNFDVERDVIQGGGHDIRDSLQEDFKLDIGDDDVDNATAADGERPGVAESSFLLNRRPGSRRPALSRRLRRRGAGRPRRRESLLAAGRDRRDFWTAEKEFTVPNTGDVFTLGRLMELAGASLDLDHTFDGLSLRQAGTALEVRVVYSNMYHFYSFFGYREVKYHYEVKELMMPTMERYVLAAAQPHDFPKHRKYELQHGVLVWFKVDGSFGFFSLVNLFIMLAAAGALMSSAKLGMDLWAVYLHREKDNYFHLKYDVSDDFSTMWKCSKCGFKNLPDSEVCTGVPAWFHPNETPPCREPREDEDVPFKGFWVDRSGSFYGGAVIKIAEASWQPMNLPSLDYRTVSFARRSTSDASCELLEVRRQGETLCYNVTPRKTPDDGTSPARSRALQVRQSDSAKSWLLHLVSESPAKRLAGEAGESSPSLSLVPH